MALNNWKNMALKTGLRFELKRDILSELDEHKETHFTEIDVALNYCAYI